MIPKPLPPAQSLADVGNQTLQADRFLTQSRWDYIPLAEGRLKLDKVRLSQMSGLDRDATMRSVQLA
jgi:hypothetical protein